MNERVVLDGAMSAAVEAFVAAGVVVVCVLLGGLIGLRIKLFRSILFFGGVVAGAVFAFLGCELTGRLLAGAGIPAGWSLVAGYGLCLLLSFIIIALFTSIYIPSRVMTYFATLDNFGGIAVGVLAGLLLASIVRVGFAMAPFPASSRPGPNELQADITPQVLQMIAKATFIKSEDEQAWLFGVRDVDDDSDVQLGKVAISEPFVDLNSNQTREDTEPFLDKNGDEEFTEQYVIFAPGNEDLVPVGVMDRYWLGDWQLVTVMFQNVDP